MTYADFIDFLDKITLADVLRALADVAEGRRKHRFRRARKWDIVVAGRRFPHRPVIAFAAERHIGRMLSNKLKDFDWDRDRECRKRLKQLGFKTKSKVAAPTKV